MARRLVCGFLVAFVGCATFGTAGAGAATEIGSGCDPDFGGAVEGMAMQQSRVTAPTALKTTSPGVVTSWKVQSAPFLEPRTMTLKVFRQVAAEYEVVGESAPELVLGQPNNQFPTRIPVGAGVGFGTASSASNPGCTNGQGGDVIANFNANVPVGGKAKPSGTTTGAVVSLAVVIEPDADGDGYGDETQDQCPQSPAAQGACPAPPGGGGVGGAAFKLKGKPRLERNVVAVKIATSARARLTVTGSIRGKRAARPASKTVSPGETGRLYLRLSKATRQRLANLPRKRKLRMVVEVKATGSPTVSAEISLPGRKKPQRAGAPR